METINSKNLSFENKNKKNNSIVHFYPDVKSQQEKKLRLVVIPNLSRQSKYSSITDSIGEEADDDISTELQSSKKNEPSNKDESPQSRTDIDYNLKEVYVGDHQATNRQSVNFESSIYSNHSLNSSFSDLSKSVSYADLLKRGYLSKRKLPTRQQIEFLGPVSQSNDTIEYTPVHFSSGELSVVLHNIRKRHVGPTVQYPSTRLWADNSVVESMDEREQRLMQPAAGKFNAESRKQDSMSIMIKKRQDDVALMMEAVQYLFLFKCNFSRSKASQSNSVCSRNKLLQKSSDAIQLQAMTANLRVEPKIYHSIDEFLYGSTGKRENEGKKTPEVTQIMKDKLLNLGKFVADHANRKLQAAWDVIEIRFNQSPLTKILMEAVETGLLHPVKYRALKCSSLVGLLCSQKVRVKHNELSVVLRKLGYTDDDIYLGRQIAAYRAVLNGIKDLQNNTTKSVDIVFREDAAKNYEKVAVQLKEMIKREENGLLVSIKEFRQSVYPLEEETVTDGKGKVTETLPGLKTHIDEKIHEIIEENMKLDKEKEQAERLKKQAIIDFDNVVHTVQPSLGPLTIGRHDALRSLIDYCEKIVALKIAENNITVSDEVLSYLGIDAFPQYIQNAIAAKKSRRREDIERIRKAGQFKVDLNDTRSTSSRRNSKFADLLEESYVRFPKTRPSKDKSVSKMSSNDPYSGSKTRPEDSLTGFNGKFRLKFAGIFYLLHVMISNEKNMFGYTSSEIAELMQAYASTRIQACYRAHRRRWRFDRALRLASDKIIFAKASHFYAWRTVAVHNVMNYKHCFRKVVAWKYYTTILKRKREYFRITFWPFFVWRRYTNRKGTAREKAKFLVSRLLPTLTQITVFNAWKAYISKKVLLHQLTQQYIAKINAKRKLDSFQWLLARSKYKLRLRKAWHRSSLDLASRRKIYDLKNIPLSIWKTFVYYQKEIHSHVKQYSMTCRSLLLPNRMPIQTYTRAERRRRYRAFKRRILLAELEEIERERVRLENQDKEWNLASPGFDSSSEDTRVLVSPKSRSVNTSVFSQYQDALRRKFDWKQKKTTYDFDSDDESEFIESYERCPSFRRLVNVCSPSILHLHGIDQNIITESIVEPLSCLDQVPFIKYLKHSVITKIQPIRNQLQKADMWGIFEGSMRFHRYAARCFRNLRDFAIIQRNHRLAINKRNKQMLKIAFKGLVAWMERDPEYVKGHGVQSDSEIMANIVRKNRLERMARRRQATIDIEANFGRHLDSEIYADTIAKLSVESFSEQYDYNQLTVQQPDFSQESKSNSETTNRKRKTKTKKDSKFRGSGSKNSSNILDSSQQTKNARNNKSNINSRSVHLERSSRRPYSKEGSKPKSNINLGSRLDELSSVSMSDDGSNPRTSESLNESIKSDTLKSLVKRLSNSNSTESLKPPQVVMSHKSLTIQSTIDSSLIIPQKTILSPLPEGKELDDSSFINDQFIQETKYEPPNFLTWDRQDREIERHLVEQISQMSHNYHHKTVNTSSDAGLKSVIIEDMRLAREKLLIEIMNREDEIITNAIKNEMDYVKKFFYYAGANLVITIERIFNSIQVSLDRKQMKCYFRAIRLPMLIRRSKKMLTRKRIANWIRICRRLNVMNDRAPFYRQIRMKWIIYNRWLKFIYDQSTICSPNFALVIKRRCELYRKFSNRLTLLGFEKMVYLDNSRLRETLNETTTVFYRWLTYIQEKALFREMENRAILLYRLRLMQKCFRAIRTGMNSEDIHRYYSKSIQSNESNDCFALMRIKADLDQATRRFISCRCNSLIHVIRTYNKRFQTMQKQHGKSVLSFKRFLNDFINQSSYRLVTELRILADSFETRGSQNYVDVNIPDLKYIDKSIDEAIIGSIPAIMRHLDGKRVIDPIPKSEYVLTNDSIVSNKIEESHFQFENSVPSGYQLRKIKLNISDHENGIIGWKLVWDGDCVPEIESDYRGRWMGHHNVQEIVIAKDDFAVGLEYQYDGTVITSMRLKLLIGGWTRWYGIKSTLATTSVYLHANMASSEYSDDYVYSGLDEEDYPAMPRSYIIGFSGMEVGMRRRISSLGLVVRKIYDQHLFSYYWVQDAMDRQDERRKKQQGLLEDPTISALRASLNETVPITVETKTMLPNVPITNQSMNHSLQVANSINQSKMSTILERSTQSSDKGSVGSIKTKNSIVDNVSVIDRMIKDFRSMNSSDIDSYSEHSSAWEALDDGCYFDGSDEGSDSSSPASPIAHRRSSVTASQKERRLTVTLSSSIASILGSNQQSNLRASVAKSKKIQTPFHSSNITTISEHSSFTFETDEEVTLTKSEQQFFDVVRMRTTEIKVAQIRAEKLARSIWTSSVIKKHPQLSKLVSVRIISGLCRWFFEALSKQLVSIPSSEKRGLELVSAAHVMRIKADMLTKQIDRTHIHIRQLESKKYPWTNNSFLSPQERQEKQALKEELRSHRMKIKNLEAQSKELAYKAYLSERQGRLLLPRIQLSQYICHSYWTKIAAARTKESLLERVSLSAIKEALCGIIDSDGPRIGLSNLTMTSVKTTLLSRQNHRGPMKTLLDKIVDEEVEQDRRRRSDEETRMKIIQQSIEEQTKGSSKLRESIFSESKTKPKHQRDVNSSSRQSRRVISQNGGTATNRPSSRQTNLKISTNGGDIRLPAISKQKN